MSGAPSFVLRPEVRILAGLLTILCLFLGRWQLRRDVERNLGREQGLLVAGMPPLGDDEPLWPSSAWRTVAWQGRIVPPAVLMAGTQRGGERGYDVLVAFERDTGETVLVDRGWVSAEAAEASVESAASVGSPMLTGQLRPMMDKKHTPPLAGHGTRIFSAGDFSGAANALGVSDSVFVVEGRLDGTSTRQSPPIDGFTPVPARDNTSLHYASQWFAIAGIGLLFTFPGPLIYLRKKVSA